MAAWSRDKATKPLYMVTRQVNRTLHLRFFANKVVSVEFSYHPHPHRLSSSIFPTSSTSTTAFTFSICFDMPHSSAHHSTTQSGKHSSNIPSSLRSLSRRASQFLRRDHSHDGQEDVALTNEEDRKHAISFDYGCVPPLSLIRKRSQKTQAPVRYSIVPDSPLRNPAPQIPEIRDLSKGRVVRKAKSLAIIPSTGQRLGAAQDLADDVVLAFRDPRSLDLERDLLMMPGAFPKSSSPITDGSSSNFMVSPLPVR